MGQTLSEPITAKESAFCQNEHYRVGSSCMQGWRDRMEDSHTQILSLPDDPGTAFFGVYDGHGGSEISQYAGKNLHKYIINSPEYQQHKIETALQNGFINLDTVMLSDNSLRDAMAGSTAVVVLIKENMLYCANAGDSRAIASVNGNVDALSFDHKPTNEVEYRRIKAGGGWVEYNRVNGNLALSRALGDFIFKRNPRKKPEQQIVTAFPDVEIRKITGEWEFVVIACDGIWDVLTNEEVLDFVRQQIAEGILPDIICENLMNHCLAPDSLMSGIGGDNMTVIIICFLHQKPYENLIERCKSSLKSPISSDVENDTATASSISSETSGINENINDVK